MFVGIHALLAQSTDTPELAISEAEGKAFMASAQNVMRHYSVETTQKTLDWIAFMGTASGMYIPRMAAISMKRKGRARQSTTPQRPQAQRPQQPQAGPAPLAIVPDQFSTTGFQDVGE